MQSLTAHACNPNTKNAEVGRLLIQHQPETHKVQTCPKRFLASFLTGIFRLLTTVAKGNLAGLFNQLTLQYDTVIHKCTVSHPQLSWNTCSPQTTGQRYLIILKHQIIILSVIVIRLPHQQLCEKPSICIVLSRELILPTF